MEVVVEVRKTFHLSYQNKSCSECQQDFKKIEGRNDRQTERLFSLVIKTKVVQNVNRVSERQTDRVRDRGTDRMTETDRQNDRLAGQLKSPLLFLSGAC